MLKSLLRNCSPAVCAIACLCATTGCEWKDKSLEGIPEGWADLQLQIKELTKDPGRSIEELKKLRQIEYRVVDLAADIEAASLEQELNTLGKESWDCSILRLRESLDNSSAGNNRGVANLVGGPQRSEKQLNPAIRLVCKRSTPTPLRFIVK